jgi:rsbT co-antagonist protein RsbR
VEQRPQVMAAMLGAIGAYGAQYLIVDITGLAMMDTAIAHYLLQAARVMLVGIGPEVAQMVVGMEFGGIATRAAQLSAADSFTCRDRIWGEVA